jgi:hypothetical protein
MRTGMSYFMLCLIYRANANTPLRRYTFLLYKQSRAFTDQTLVNASTSITLFNISKFASALDLGNPIAGTSIQFPSIRTLA